MWVTKINVGFGNPNHFEHGGFKVDAHIAFLDWVVT
jgi:hypothetical protein